MIIVTASDAGFFDLLRGLLLSIEARRGDSSVAIGLLDLGLTAQQRAWAEPRVTRIVSPGWDMDVPEALRREKPHLRGLTVRPFLPRHFPGYDSYLWIDADVWLQDWRGVELYGLGAQSRDITLTPHSDRCYLFNQSVFRHRYKQFLQAYGKEVADELAVGHHLNAGIFSASAASPLWDAWATAYQTAIDASEGAMMSDQIALNFVCYRRPLTGHLLPALYNWQCHLALPFWNPQLGKFCEPQLPNAPLSLLHLTYNSKEWQGEVRGTDQRSHKMDLHYRPPVAVSD